MTSSSSFTNVSSLILLYNLAETTEGTEGNQEEFKDAEEEAIDTQLRSLIFTKSLSYKLVSHNC